MREFLEEKVDSFEKFEVLRRLWLREGELWNAASLVDGFLVPDDVLASSLAELVRVGLIKREGKSDQYCAATGSPDASLVTSMLSTYASDPLGLLKILNDLALRRLRGLAARKFADAFVVSRRREPGDG